MCSCQASSRFAFVISRGEEMAEETTGDEEDDAGDSTEARVQEPELGGRHFFEKAADPTDEIIRGKECEIIDADDSGGQGDGRDARVKRERNRKDICESNAVEEVERNE